MGIRFFSTLETWHARQTAGDVWEWSGKVVWCFAFYSRIPDRESSICVPRFAIDIPVEKFSRKFFVNETRECGEKAHNRLSLYVNLSQLAVGEAAARRRLVFIFLENENLEACATKRGIMTRSREKCERFITSSTLFSTHVSRCLRGWGVSCTRFCCCCCCCCTICEARRVK